ncbi:MAG: coproporphyrinogen III oxidase [bacterium]
MKLPSTPHAKAAFDIVTRLQDRFAAGLTAATAGTDPSGFERVEWHRDGGEHGGGWRYSRRLTPAFNRASINISAIQYDDMPDKRLSSATAISTIIHPSNALAPSVHMHISWTEMRDGTGYWRIMGDLNPATALETDTVRFRNALKEALGDRYDEAVEQGEKYFFIPCAGRHRGVVHFYLEGFNTGDFDADASFAQQFGEVCIDTYCGIFEGALKRQPTPEDVAAQLRYHTLYLLQVLTLDRGTTSGLLVHDQNDAGILGSLPSYADVDLLLDWTHNQDRRRTSYCAGLPMRCLLPGKRSRTSTGWRCVRWCGNTTDVIPRRWTCRRREASFRPRCKTTRETSRHLKQH